MADNQVQVMESESQMQEDSPQPSGSNQILSMIERMSTNPDVRMDVLEKMFQMKKEHDDRMAKCDFNDAMAETQFELSKMKIHKNKKNEHTRSSYADLAAITEQIAPIYSSNGLSLSFNQEPFEDGNKVKVTCAVSHSTGHTEYFSLVGDLDAAGSQGKTNKTGIQAIGSTLSYLRRYLTLMIFNIATYDDNDGNGKPQPEKKITPAQRDAIINALEDSDKSIETFCKVAKIQRVDDLLAKNFDSAMARIRNASQKKEKNDENKS